eukprot:TRINITY_DN1089_c0_g2_i3.p1 TRINITY_DN1089_c0_g2~~TRINITY_DN1089_c0_g2_i3.p1  ORF type:complete len:250 (-),score=-8.07 TRINITY_DN1089_c0_g2_i3:227-871(-)
MPLLQEMQTTSNTNHTSNITREHYRNINQLTLLQQSNLQILLIFFQLPHYLLFIATSITNIYKKQKPGKQSARNKKTKQNKMNDPSPVKKRAQICTNQVCILHFKDVDKYQANLPAQKMQNYFQLFIVNRKILKIQRIIKKQIESSKNQIDTKQKQPEQSNKNITIFYVTQAQIQQSSFFPNTFFQQRIPLVRGFFQIFQTSRILLNKIQNFEN